MKKLIFAVAIVLVGASFSSCKKCASCDIGNTTEYCRGGVIENALYDSAKDSCQNSGGKWS